MQETPTWGAAMGESAMVGESAPVVLVTGSCGGIGKVTADLFAKHHYRLALTDLDLDQVSEQASRLAEQGVDVEGFACDITDAHSVGRLFDRVIDRFGRIDAAFNNAGRGGGAVPLTETEDDLWHACIQVNLTGTFLCMKQELKIMSAQGYGSIVNNCSILGLHGGASAPYTASKHGIAGLTKTGALSYASKGIRVNAVCPGLIDAGLGLKVLSRPPEVVRSLIDMHPMARPGTAAEVASAVVWLSSPEASFINGHMLSIDGGYGCH